MKQFFHNQKPVWSILESCRMY